MKTRFHAPMEKVNGFSTDLSPFPQGLCVIFHNFPQTSTLSTLSTILLYMVEKWKMENGVER